MARFELLVRQAPRIQTETYNNNFITERKNWWFIMASFPEAEARIFENKHVCMKCGMIMRAPKGKLPERCRKCKDTSSFRRKHKRKK